MSAEPIFDSMHADLMAEYGQPGFVARGVAPLIPVTVIIDRGVAIMDDTGRVVRRVDIVSCLNTEWQPLQGDILTVGAWSKGVDGIDSDDGFVTKAVMYG